MTSQSPIKASEATKERIRYIAALTDATQAAVVDRAVAEYAARHADDIQEGIERARSVLAGGKAAIAAHLLDMLLRTCRPRPCPPFCTAAAAGLLASPHLITPHSRVDSDVA